MNTSENRIKSMALEKENEQAFQSNLLDINMAKEISKLKRNNIHLLINILLLNQSME